MGRSGCFEAGMATGVKRQAKSMTVSGLLLVTITAAFGAYLEDDRVANARTVTVTETTYYLAPTVTIITHQLQPASELETFWIPSALILLVIACTAVISY